MSGFGDVAPLHEGLNIRHEGRALSQLSIQELEGLLGQMGNAPPEHVELVRAELERRMAA